MKLQNDKFIGTIISKNRVIFKGKDGVIYEKKIKEKNNKVVVIYVQCEMIFIMIL